MNQVILAAVITAGAVTLGACGGSSETTAVATSTIAEESATATITEANDDAPAPTPAETPATETQAVEVQAVETQAVEPAPTPAETETVAVSHEDAAAAAAVNAETIVGSDNWRTSEVLDVATGAITTLEAVIDGDRPVLVWFWAPH